MQQGVSYQGFPMHEQLIICLTYSFEHTPTFSKCCGTGIYISDELEFNVLEKYSICHPKISESTFIEIENNCGYLYWHHAEVSDFIDVFLIPTLEKLSNSNLHFCRRFQC